MATRTCDWCHGNRPQNDNENEAEGNKSVSIIDKDTQLQFCNQECLAQFKMDLFCRETHAQTLAATAAAATNRFAGGGGGGAPNGGSAAAAAAAAADIIGRYRCLTSFALNCSQIIA